MSTKKLINFSEVSLKLTGNKNTIRANRNNANYATAIDELVLYLDDWVARNAKQKEAKVIIKTK